LLLLAANTAAVFVLNFRARSDLANGILAAAESFLMTALFLSYRSLFANMVARAVTSAVLTEFVTRPNFKDNCARRLQLIRQSRAVKLLDPITALVYKRGLPNLHKKG
jgi:hypothetical protein